MADLVLPYLLENMTCVEFGSGAGHLSLLLAYLRPKTQFVLVELREFSATVAQAKAVELGTPFCSTKTEFRLDECHIFYWRSSSICKN